jgi:ligand-binding SRPBCC domain-containing protein
MAETKFLEFEQSTLLPHPIEEVFSFFSQAENLETLTPSWLKFQLLTPVPVKMRVGAQIDYKLRIRGVPLHWKSWISVWEPPYRFVDEQLKGPYREWIHEHRFERVEEEGTRMTDYIRYRVPGGWIVDRLFVRRDLERIFRYRTEKIQSFFRIDRRRTGWARLT